VPTLRMLQVSELKRAMGFDEDYRVEHGARRDKIKILGNAVSPPVMTAIIQSLCGDALHRRTTEMRPRVITRITWAGCAADRFAVAPPRTSPSVPVNPLSRE
jgi:C-5 cytosine-specific DNA methylase